MKLPSLNFATKLAIALSLFAVLPLTLVGYSISVLNLNTLKNLSRELYLAVAKNVVLRLEQRAQDAAKLLFDTAQILDNRSLSPSDVVHMISTSMANYPDIHTIGVYDEQGQFIDAFVKSSPAPLPKVFPQPLRAGLDSLPSVLHVADEFQVATKWMIDKKFAGYLLTQLEHRALASWIGEISAQTFSGARDRIYLLDAHLRLFAHTDTVLAAQHLSLLGKGLFEGFQQPEDVLRAKAVGVSREYIGVHGEAMLGTWLAVPSLQVVIVVEEPQRIAYFSVHEMQRRVLYGSLAGIVLSIGVSVFLARWLNTPIKQLVSAAQRFIDQDFSFRLPIQRQDEFAPVFRAYNDAAETLERYQKINIDRIIAERNKLDAALRQASDGMIVLDASRHVILVNHLFAQWFSLPEQDLSASPEPFEHYLTHESLRHHIESVYACSNTVVPAEFRVQMVGEVREIVLRGAFVRVLHAGELVAVLGALRNVTKEVEIDRMKTELVSLVAHELRSPLATISGFSSFIVENPALPSDTREIATIIYKESERLGNIVTKFLDLNRIESGRTEIQRIAFKLHDVIRTVVEINRPLADAKHIRVELALPSASTTIAGDPELIGQVVLNLFSNAVKYSPPNTTVRIQMLEHQHEMEVSVQDEGYGISASAKEKLFSKFFRAVDDERVRSVTGTGLGLAFVKEVVEKHGGKVGVESELYKGSRFWFTLPK